MLHSPFLKVSTTDCLNHWLWQVKTVFVTFLHDQILQVFCVHKSFLINNISCCKSIVQETNKTEKMGSCLRTKYPVISLLIKMQSIQLMAYIELNITEWTLSSRYYLVSFSFEIYEVSIPLANHIKISHKFCCSTTMAFKFYYSK